VLVKICGITRADDARVAVESGAGAIGFLFWPGSPRVITPAVARRIVRTLPPFVTPVGVFVNQAAREINAVADEVGLGAVQLHGDETAADASAIERPVVKAVTLAGDDADVEAAVGAWPDSVVLLVDAADAERRGGTGRLADWANAARVARRRPVLLAGGLGPENVGEAIRRVAPFGLDVSSGVESSPGIKDHQRLRALFQAIGRASHDVDHDAARS
jgi:phosphoribosylanthranilate isomerase